MLEHGITKERLPFVYGWHRLSVTAPTRELCQRRVEALVEHYRDIGIDVVNSTGDQFSLLCESLPGDRVRLSSYVQRQPLYTIAGGVPTATVDLGDRPMGGLDGGEGWMGPYIGETLGRARSIVHFDPLLAATRNRPTAVAITGEPGGGKTTLALLMIMQLALRGRDGRGHRPQGGRRVAGGRAGRARPQGPGAPARLGRARAARPVLVRRRPGREADDGHRDAAAAAAADERGARERDDPGGGRGREPGAAQPGQGRPAPGAGRGPRVEEPGRGAALDVGDAAGPAVLRALGRAAHRRGRVDHGLHPGRPHAAGHRGRAGTTSPTSSGCRSPCCTWFPSSRAGC